MRYSCFRAKFWTRDITCAKSHLGTKKRYMRKSGSRHPCKLICFLRLVLLHILFLMYLSFVHMYLLAHVMSRVQNLARKHEYFVRRDISRLQSDLTGG